MANVTDGSVVWAVKTINDFLPKAGGIMTGNILSVNNTGSFSAGYSYDEKNGARIVCRGSKTSSYPGTFEVQSCDGENRMSLYGSATNEALTWNGKSILKQEYFSTSGHSGHSCVLKLGNVLIMAGQVQASSAAASHTIKFPQTFLNNNTYGVTVTPYAGDGASRKCTITNQGKDFVSVAVDTAVSWLFYVAIGQYK